MTTIDVTELDLRDRADDQFVDAHVRGTVEHELHGAADILRAEHDRACFGIRDDWTEPEEVAVHIARTEVAGRMPLPASCALSVWQSARSADLLAL